MHLSAHFGGSTSLSATEEQLADDTQVLGASVYKNLLTTHLVHNDVLSMYFSEINEKNVSMLDLMVR